MLRRISPSPAMMVAVAALVMSVAGTGYAAAKLPAQSVGPKQLRNNAVTTPKLKNNAVTGAKIQHSTIGEREVGEHALTAHSIATDTLTGSEINESLLSTVPTAASAPVQGLQYNARSEMLAPETGVTAHADCPPDKRPISGGARVNDPVNLYMVDEFPQGNGWTVNVANPSPDLSGFTIYVTCAPAGQASGPVPKVQGKQARRFRVTR
jgi:hypothetical protein